MTEAPATDVGPGRFSWNRSDDFQTGESTQSVTVTPEGTTVGLTNDSAASTTSRWRATSNEGNGAFSSSQGFSFSDTTSFSGGTVSDDTSTLTVRNFTTGNAWANSKQRSAASIDGGQGSTVGPCLVPRRILHQIAWVGGVFDGGYAARGACYS